MSNEKIAQPKSRTKSDERATALESIRGLNEYARQRILTYFARAAQELADDDDNLHEETRHLFAALNALEAIDGELDAAGTRSHDELDSRKGAVQ